MWVLGFWVLFIIVGVGSWSFIFVEILLRFGGGGGVDDLVDVVSLCLFFFIFLNFFIGMVNILVWGFERYLIENGRIIYYFGDFGGIFEYWFDMVSVDG